MKPADNPLVDWKSNFFTEIFSKCRILLDFYKLTDIERDAISGISALAWFIICFNLPYYGSEDKEK